MCNASFSSDRSMGFKEDVLKLTLKNVEINHEKVKQRIKKENKNHKKGVRRYIHRLKNNKSHDIDQQIKSISKFSKMIDIDQKRIDLLKELKSPIKVQKGVSMIEI